MMTKARWENGGNFGKFIHLSGNHPSRDLKLKTMLNVEKKNPRPGSDLIHKQLAV